MGQIVSSYALFGSNPSYWNNIALVIKAHKAIVPQWGIYIFHDSNINTIRSAQKLIDLQKDGHIKLIQVDDNTPRCKAMLWRMLPVWDDEVDYVFCKDADTLPTYKEFQIAAEFIQSNYSVLGINDNPAHGIALMGGMVGFNTKRFRKLTNLNSFNDMVSLMEPNFNWDQHGADQIMLNQKILPKVLSQTIIYRVFDGATKYDGINCKLEVPNINISNNEYIHNHGNRFTNYAGACGVNMDLVEIHKFYDAHGNTNVNSTLNTKRSRKEKDMIIDKNNKKKVIFSTDPTPMYFFYAPYTSIMWQAMAGYSPILLALKNTDPNIPNNKRYQYTLDFCRDLGVQIVELEHHEGRPGSVIVQSSRLYAGALGLSDDTYVLTSDIDMWPLTTHWFNEQDWSKKVHLFYANAYNHTKYAICYIGMHAPTWREVMKIAPSMDINTAIKSQLDIHLPLNSSSDDNWVYDERLFYGKISQWSGYPHNCHMIPRAINGQPVGRIDRSAWHTNYNPQVHVDAHLIRPGWSPENWPRLQPLLFKLIGHNKVYWEALESYRKGFEVLL